MSRTVLHVSEAVLGGVRRVLLDLATEQRRLGWTVFVATPPDAALAAELHRGGVTALPWPAAPGPTPALAGELLRLRALLRRVRPDLVHLHSSKAGLAGRLVVRGAIPTILQPHAWSFLAREGRVARATLNWERLAARWTTCAVCVSEDERRVAAGARLALPTVVVPNGIDLVRFPPADAEARRAARARLGVAPDVPLAVCVGRLHRQKGQGALLDAWPLVRDQVPGAEVALVGEGPDGERLAGRAVPGVRLVGQSDEVPGWLAAADVVVAPSRWEGLSLGVLEAMATGRPLVVTDVPGMGLVGPRVGARVHPGNPRALAGAVATRLLDPALASREGTAGRRYVEAHHDLRRTLDLLVTLSEELAR